jgi:hypothetical protein
MKRIGFYVNVIIIAVFFTGSFAAILWFLSSRILTKIFESEFSFFTLTLFLPLYMLISVILSIVMLSAACFFIYRANIRYKKSSRSFTVLRSDPTGGREALPLFPAPYFAMNLYAFGCFVPVMGIPYMNFGLKPYVAPSTKAGASPGDPPRDNHWAFSPGRPAGKGNIILPFPRGGKNRRK